MAAEPPTLHTSTHLELRWQNNVLCNCTWFQSNACLFFPEVLHICSRRKVSATTQSLTFSLAKGNCITMICTWWKVFNFFITSLDRKSGAATLAARSWCQRDLYSSCIQVCLHQSPAEDIEQKHCNQFKILLPEKDHTCVNCDTTFSNICFFTTSLKFWDFNSNQILW